MGAPSWPEIHGAFTHFPVALLILAACFDIGSILFRQPDWRKVSFWLLVAAVVLALPALVAGWMTMLTLFDGSSILPWILVRHRFAAFATEALAVILLIWRSTARDRLEGAGLIGSVLLMVLVGAVVGYTGFLGGRMVFAANLPEPTKETSAGPKPMAAHPSARKTGQGGALSQAQVTEGERLFNASGCLNCHRMDGRGGSVGPDLTHEGSRHPDPAWQEEHLKNPQSKSPGSMMPSFARLGEQNVRALSAFLVSRK